MVYKTSNFASVLHQEERLKCKGRMNISRRKWKPKREELMTRNTFTTSKEIMSSGLDKI